ncbi:MAG: hypothetical protein IJX17_04945 [Clostridia bacterium]|nr:hypothetical protein [Clostridia bacterium]
MDKIKENEGLNEEVTEVENSADAQSENDNFDIFDDDIEIDNLLDELLTEENKKDDDSENIDKDVDFSVALESSPNEEVLEESFDDVIARITNSIISKIENEDSSNSDFEDSLIENSDSVEESNFEDEQFVDNLSKETDINLETELNEYFDERHKLEMALKEMVIDNNDEETNDFEKSTVKNDNKQNFEPLHENEFIDVLENLQNNLYSTSFDDFNSTQEENERENLQNKQGEETEIIETKDEEITSNNIESLNENDFAKMLLNMKESFISEEVETIENKEISVGQTELVDNLKSEEKISEVKEEKSNEDDKNELIKKSIEELKKEAVEDLNNTENEENNEIIENADNLNIGEISNIKVNENLESAKNKEFIEEKNDDSKSENTVKEKDYMESYNSIFAEQDMFEYLTKDNNSSKEKEVNESKLNEYDTNEIIDNASTKENKKEDDLIVEIFEISKELLKKVQEIRDINENSDYKIEVSGESKLIKSQNELIEVIKIEASKSEFYFSDFKDKEKISLNYLRCALSVVSFRFLEKINKSNLEKLKSDLLIITNNLQNLYNIIEETNLIDSSKSVIESLDTYAKNLPNISFDKKLFEKQVLFYNIESFYEKMLNPKKLKKGINQLKKSKHLSDEEINKIGELTTSAAKINNLDEDIKVKLDELNALVQEKTCLKNKEKRPIVSIIFTTLLLIFNLFLTKKVIITNNIEDCLGNQINLEVDSFFYVVVAINLASVALIFLLSCFSKKFRTTYSLAVSMLIMYMFFNLYTNMSYTYETGINYNFYSLCNKIYYGGFVLIAIESIIAKKFKIFILLIALYIGFDFLAKFLNELYYTHKYGY